MVAGYTPNELLDTRNMYLDKLSGYLNIYVENNDDGTVFVKIGDVYLIHGQTVNSIEVNPGYPVILSDSSGNEFIVSNGQPFAHLQLLNGSRVYASGNESDFQGGEYNTIKPRWICSRRGLPRCSTALMSKTALRNRCFAGDSYGNITASTISISDDWLSDAMYITASTQENPVAGANDNIIRMIQAMDANHVISPPLRVRLLTL